MTDLDDHDNKKKENNLTSILNKAGKIGGSAIENLSHLAFKPKKKVDKVENFN